MMTSNLYTTTWRCSCNKDNSLAHKKCKVCGADISTNMLEQVYKEEIQYQNIKHAEEEKRRKIVLIVIVGVCLLNAPLILKLLAWVFMIMLFLVGTFAGIRWIINKYQK